MKVGEFLSSTALRKFSNPVAPAFGPTSLIKTVDLEGRKIVPCVAVELLRRVKRNCI